MQADYARIFHTLVSLTEFSLAAQKLLTTQKRYTELLGALIYLSSCSIYVDKRLESCLLHC